MPTTNRPTASKPPVCHGGKMAAFASPSCVCAFCLNVFLLAVLPAQVRVVRHLFSACASLVVIILLTLARLVPSHPCWTCLSLLVSSWLFDRFVVSGRWSYMILCLFRPFTCVWIVIIFCWISIVWSVEVLGRCWESVWNYFVDGWWWFFLNN